MSRKKIIKNYDDEGNLISKECSCCHEIKPVSEFHKCKRNTDGLQLKCKRCSKEYSKEYYKDNAESLKKYSKEYYKDNTERIKQYQKDNAERIKEYKKEYSKQYYQDNAEVIKDKQKQYYQNNAEKVKKYNREYGEKYRQDNKEKIKEYDKQYRQDNAEHYKKYRQDNKEKKKEYDKQYRQDNAEKIKKYKKQYRNKQIEESLQQIKEEIEKDPEKYNYTEGKDIYGIIYLVHNIKSDRYYVGQTTIGIDNRYNKGWLYEHSYKNSVKEDLELYGENSFEYIKLFKVAYSQYELDKLEAYYIDYYNSYENGYNETRGNIFTDRGKEK